MANNYKEMIFFRKKSLSIVPYLSGFLVLFFLLFPIVTLITSSSLKVLILSLKDPEVMKAIGLSLYTSGIATILSFLFGTPLAYILARKQFPGTEFIESLLAIPIMLPHPVIGIAILSVVGKNFWFGRILHQLGLKIAGSATGIIIVLTFVGLPFYLHMARNGFMAVSPRLENVSRSLGASATATFTHITFPLAWRSMVVGMILCCARALSEFGAVVIVAYHPMIAPVLIYERFETFGLKYARPIAVWLVVICLIFFFIVHIILKSDSEKRWLR